MKRMITVISATACAALSFGAVTNLTEDVRLTADADWRGQGVVNLGEKATIDLRGYELKTDGFVSAESARTDATDADPIHVVSSTELYSGDAKFLFDNDIRYSSASSSAGDPTKNHRICALSMPFAVVYDFVTPTSIDAYRIYYNSLGEGNNRAPKDWTFEGSLDNKNWVVLDRHESDGNWKKPDVRTFQFANRVRYRYYRLNVSKHGSSNCLELYQLEYFKTPASRTDLTYGTNGVCAATTVFSGDAAFLFDDDFRYTFDTSHPENKSGNHRVCMTGTSPTTPFEVTYDFTEPTCVNAYAIYFDAVGDNVDRAPRDWTFAGSNDGSEWTVLDTHQRTRNWACPETRTFAFPNRSNYRYYRLQITKPIDGNILELYQLEYFCRPQIITTSTLEDVTDPTGVVTANKPLYGGHLTDLFDNNFTYQGASANPQHRICVSKAYPFDLTYDFGEGKSVAVDSYRIYFNSSSGTTPPKRSPTTWTFSGTDDTNGVWTVLDSHTNEADWSKNSIHSFSFANVTPYRFYKFSFSKPNSDVLEMYQLEFFTCNGGVVHADVAEGAAITNLSVAVDGDLRVVKEGIGTFVDDVPGQTFNGGLEVNGGTYSFRREGDWLKGPIVLGGGTLSLGFRQKYFEKRFPSIVLTADSALAADANLTIGNSVADSRLDFGGHTLSMTLSPGADLNVYTVTITNGTWILAGTPTSTVYFQHSDPLDLRSVDFDFNCCYRMYQTAIAAHDLTVRATNTVGTAEAMTVYGTFKPIVAGFQGTVLADGGTLDLSATDGTLPVKNVVVDKYLSFAEGASITVHLGERKPARGTCLVSWDVDHAPPQGVTFAIDAAGSERGYGVEARADGLYFINNHGLCIIFR